MAKENKYLYDKSAETLRRLERVIVNIQNGEFEKTACNEEGIDVNKFRRFVRSHWDKDDAKKEETEIVEYSWQEEFLQDIYNDYTVPSSDFEKIYEYVLTTLSEREQYIIREHYENGMILSDIAQQLGISRERTRQILIKTKRRLNHPDRRILFENGLEYKEKLKRYKIAEEKYESHVNATARLAEKTTALEEKTSNLSEEELQRITIEHVKVDNIFSTRTQTCLKRAGVYELGDLHDYSVAKLRQIRNLGQKSIAEIVDLCHDYGIIIPEE